MENKFKLKQNFADKFKITRIFFLSLIYLLSTARFLKAQDTVPTVPLPPQPTPAEPETLPSLEEILPELKEKPVPDDADGIQDFDNTVFVKKFEIVGSTAFTPEELAQVLKPYTLRRLSFTEIVAAQQAIARLYFKQGYILHQGRFYRHKS